MALPPTHSNFPHPALIHAICSAAAAWCAPHIYDRNQAQKGEVKKAANLDGMSFKLKQAAYAKDAIQDGLNTGNRLFDVVRAMVCTDASCKLRLMGRLFLADCSLTIPVCWNAGRTAV